MDDLIRITEGNTNIELAKIMIAESKDFLPWLSSQGVRFQSALKGTLDLSRTNSFFLGGGRAMLNTLYLTAEKMGIDIFYDSEVTKLVIRDGFFESLEVNHSGKIHKVIAKAMIAASGGFESNIGWLREAWGKAADNFLIRGTPYNKGTVLKMLIDNGANVIGDPTQCHAVAIDGRAPRFDGGIITRLDCIIFGIVINRNAERFYDEGEDTWPKRYAIWGRLVAQQPDQIAYVVFDSPCLNKFMPSLYPPFSTNTLEELAEILELDSEKFISTISAFNKSVQEGDYDPTLLDNCHTKGIDPPKSNWAKKIETPPYYAYPLRPGITFTYMSVEVNQNAKIVMTNGQPSENMYAAGEIMAGNILGSGYAAGIGMAIGGTFGKIAGQQAAIMLNKV